MVVILKVYNFFGLYEVIVSFRVGFSLIFMDFDNVYECLYLVISDFMIIFWEVRKRIYLIKNYIVFIILIVL